MIDITEDPLLGIPRIAKVFDVRPDTVRQWIYDGKLKGVKINGKWKVHNSEVNRYAQEAYGND